MSQIIKIMPRADCQACYGLGMVRGDSVPYGSTTARLPDDFCDCVIEQAGDDDASEIEIELAPEIAERLQNEAEPAPDYLESEIDCPENVCPHGKLITDCNPCLIASDLAYDSMQERILK